DLRRVAFARLVGGNDDSQQEGALTVAVHQDLAHQRTVVEHGLEPGDGDEFALGQFQDVVAAVQVDQTVRRRFRDDVAGAGQRRTVTDTSRSMSSRLVSVTVRRCISLWKRWNTISQTRGTTN